MNSIDFGSHRKRIEKLRRHCKTATLMIKLKSENNWLRFVVVTHEDQCDLLNQQMNHMELVKNHILIVPFHDLLCNTTLDPILDHFWFTSQKFHPFKCCLLQRVAIRNKSVSLGSSNF